RARDRGRGRTAASDHVVLGHERAARESIEPERGHVDARRLTADELRDYFARSRRVHEPVPGEAGRADEAGYLVDRAEDRMVIRSVLVEARPSGLHGGLLERRQPRESGLDNGREEVPVDGVVEAR